MAVVVQLFHCTLEIMNEQKLHVDVGLTVRVAKT